MRKNKMMRMASGLLVLTLLTTSIISGTFAKYTTSNKASDTARVAKWGVSVTASGNLYSDMYVKQADGNKPSTVKYQEYVADLSDETTSKQHKEITVASAEVSDNVVAPGTKSADTGFTFSIDGKPEVTSCVWGTVEARDIYLAAGDYGVMIPVEVTTENYSAMQGKSETPLYVKDTEALTYTLAPQVDVKEINEETVKGKAFFVLTSATNVTAEYNPVVYKLASGNTKGITNLTAEGEINADLKSAVKVGKLIADSMGVTAVESDAEDKVGKVYTVAYNADTNAANVYAPNVDLANDTAGPNLTDETLTWEWVFEVKTGDPETVDADVDAKDTILGNMIAAYADSTIDTYFVVAKNAGVYADVKYCADDAYKYTAYLSKKEEPIASLQTYVNIELNVTQVD